MKKLSALLAILFLFTIVSCGSSGSTNQNPPATTPPVTTTPSATTSPATTPPATTPHTTTPPTTTPPETTPPATTPPATTPPVTTPPAETPSATTPLTGYDVYSSAQYGFSVQYPSGWMCLDQDALSKMASIDELLEAIGETFGEESAERFQSLFDNGIDLSSVAVTWFDLDNEIEDTNPTVNITVSDAQGITQDILKLPASHTGLQEALESMFAGMTDGVEVISDLTGKDFGKHYFTQFRYTLNMGDMKMSQYQAITVVNAKMYTFTYTVPVGYLDTSSAQFEGMLQSFDVSR